MNMINIKNNILIELSEFYNKYSYLSTKELIIKTDYFFKIKVKNNDICKYYIICNSTNNQHISKDYINIDIYFKINRNNNYIVNNIILEYDNIRLKRYRLKKLEKLYEKI